MGSVTQSGHRWGMRDDCCFSATIPLEDSCPQRQLCGGNHAATERMIQFGRELQMLSEQLCREYGKNTMHKKMLQVSLDLVLHRSGSLGSTGAVGSLAGLRMAPTSAPGEEEGGLRGDQRSKLSGRRASRPSSRHRREETQLLPASTLLSRLPSACLPMLAPLPGGRATLFNPLA